MRRLSATTVQSLSATWWTSSRGSIRTRDPLNQSASPLDAGGLFALSKRPCSDLSITTSGHSWIRPTRDMRCLVDPAAGFCATGGRHRTFPRADVQASRYRMPRMRRASKNSCVSGKRKIQMGSEMKETRRKLAELQERALLEAIRHGGPLPQAYLTISDVMDERRPAFETVINRFSHR